MGGGGRGVEEGEVEEGGGGGIAFGCRAEHIGMLISS